VLSGGRSRRLGVIAALAGALAASGASEAGAVTRPLGSGDVQAGPALAGNLVLHAQRRGPGAVILATPAANTGAQRTLTVRVPGPGEVSVGVGQLGASARAFAFSEAGTTDFGTFSGSGTFGALIGDEPAVLDRCGSGLVPGVEGDRVAAGQCEGARLTVLGPSRETRELAPPPARTPKVAGDVASWLEGTQDRPLIVVRDLVRNVELYRTPRQAGRIQEYDLQADGTVVASVATLVPRPRGFADSHTTVRMFTIARRTGRRLPLAARAHYDVRIESGRVAVLRRSEGRLGGQVLIGTPRGRFHYVVRRRIVLGFDLDATRLAWIDSRNGNARLRVVSAGGS